MSRRGLDAVMKRVDETTGKNVNGHFLLLTVCAGLGVFSWFPWVPDAVLSALKMGVFLILICYTIKGGQINIEKPLPYIFLYSAFLAPPLIYSIFILGPSQLSQITYLIIPIFMGIIISGLNHKELALVAVLSGFVYGVLVHAIWIIASYLLSYNPAPFSIVGGYSTLPYSVMGLANSHTMASPLLGLAGGILLFATSSLAGPLAHTRYKLPLIIFLFSAQSLTGGEGGMIVYFAAVFGVVLLQYFRKPLLIAISAMLLTYLAFNIVGPYLSDSLYTSYLEHKIANSAGLEMFVENPLFGVGFSQSYIHFNDVISELFYSEKLYSNSLTPHTPYGLILAEAGLFGLAALTALLFCVMQSIKNVSGGNPLDKASYFVLLYFLLLSFLEPWPMISNFYVLYIFYGSLIYLYPGRSRA